MKKASILTGFLVFCFCVTETSFAIWGSHPKIDEKHIARDLIGTAVRGWTFEKAAPCRIKILDAEYDKETAVVYISIRTIDTEGKSGREGKLRLEYEYAADDWNILDIKPISFSKLEQPGVNKLKDLIGYPLFLAAEEGDVAAVKSLIAQGVDVNEKDNHGVTALMWATTEGHLDVARILLSKGADVNAKHSRGWTPLIIAAFSGQAHMVKLLLSKGANVNVKSGNGQTALMLAIQSTSFNKNFASNERILCTLKVLLLNGANVNVKDREGRTALSHAIAPARFFAVKILLDNGANVNLRDNYGATPLTWAKQQGYTNMIQLLEKAGGKE